MCHAARHPHARSSTSRRPRPLCPASPLRRAAARAVEGSNFEVKRARVRAEVRGEAEADGPVAIGSEWID